VKGLSRFDSRTGFPEFYKNQINYHHSGFIMGCVINSLFIVQLLYLFL
jgi:hypothetical protein